MDYNQPGPEESSSGVELPSSANFLTSIATVTAATNRDSKTPRASVSDSSANVQCPPSNQNGFATRPPGAQTLEELIGEVRTLRNTASPSDTPTPNGTGAISSTPTPQDGSINPVSQLYELSAIRGITPVFDMIHNGPSGFSVVLTLGVGISVLQEKGPFPSKNIAKYTIARRGCEVVRNLPELKAQKTVIDSSASRSDQENCIGILQGRPWWDSEHVMRLIPVTRTRSSRPRHPDLQRARPWRPVRLHTHLVKRTERSFSGHKHDQEGCQKSSGAGCRPVAARSRRSTLQGAAAQAQEATERRRWRVGRMRCLQNRQRRATDSALDHVSAVFHVSQHFDSRVM